MYLDGKTFCIRYQNSGRAIASPATSSRSEKERLGEKNNFDNTISELYYNSLSKKSE